MTREAAGSENAWAIWRLVVVHKLSAMHVFVIHRHLDDVVGGPQNRLFVRFNPSEIPLSGPESCQTKPFLVAFTKKILRITSP